MEKCDVTLELTQKCNHTCHYCVWHDNRSPFVNRERMLKIIEHIFKLNKPAFDFYLYGGEPTIYPWFEDIMDKIYEHEDKLFAISIQTNLKKPIEWYQSIVQKYPKLMFSASFQSHQVKDHKPFMEKLKWIHEQGSLLSCDYLLEYEDPKTVKERYLDIKGIGVPVDLRTVEYGKKSQALVRDIVYKKAYADITGDLEDDEANRRREGAEENWNGYKCDAGYKTVFIGEDGRAYVCFAHRLKDKSREIGNIVEDFEKVNQTLSKPVTCRWRTCQCIVDYVLPKWKE